MLVLPESRRELRLTLALRMGLAAVVLGFAAGTVSYLVETERAESSALERAAQAARHFESRAMRLVAVSNAASAHSELKQLAERNRVAGIRVFDAAKAPVYETWTYVTPQLQDALRAQPDDWPLAGKSVRMWSDIAGARVIRVVLPLVREDNGIAGYLESITELDSATMSNQRTQVRSGVLTAAVSVLVALVLLYPLMLGLLDRSAQLSRGLMQSNLDLMRSLGNAVAKRDSATDAHNYRVTHYAVALAEAMGLEEKPIADLVVGAFLHDVGKIGIPDKILLKPDKLTDDEFAIMKGHVPLATEIVPDTPWLHGATLIIRHHHERYDGSGYPDGLSGSAIPLTARIFSVADAFDAVTSERPYKRPTPVTDALTVFRQESGRQFDPQVVDALMQVAPSVFMRLSACGRAELRKGLDEILERYFRGPVMPPSDHAPLRILQHKKETARFTLRRST